MTVYLQFTGDGNTSISIHPNIDLSTLRPQLKSVTVNGITTLLPYHLTQDKYSRGGQSLVDGTEITKRMQHKVTNSSSVIFFYWRYNPWWVCILQPSSGL